MMGSETVRLVLVLVIGLVADWLSERVCLLLVSDTEIEPLAEAVFESDGVNVDVFVIGSDRD